MGRNLCWNNEVFDSNGIVINKKDFGEADRYITIFTETFGKVMLL